MLAGQELRDVVTPLNLQEAWRPLEQDRQIMTEAASSG
jgi:hypothetical protein